MTERLYYDDCYLSRFDARVTSASEGGLRVYLDRTAFYPASGGQPNDRGTLNGASVLDVIDEGDAIAHVVSKPLSEGEVHGSIDWRRRFDFMQQHTGQHLLSAVFEAEFGFRTVSVHFGEEISTLDLEAGAVSAEHLGRAEQRANELTAANHSVRIGYEEASAAGGLRKPSERAGDLRIVTIEGLDRSACGGTHVRTTGEIGLILLRKSEKIRGNTRVEFLCGLRAASRASADFDVLSGVARLFSASLEDTPALVEALNEQVRELEKARRKLASELAGYRGRELYGSCVPGAGGRRVHIAPTGALDDENRALAQSFTAQPAAIFLASADKPPAVLLAASEDTGLHAGNTLKELLALHGGRGGGNARIAQGSLPSAEALDALLKALADHL